jgi:hypothetical protein
MILTSLDSAQKVDLIDKAFNPFSKSTQSKHPLDRKMENTTLFVK